MSRTPTKRRCYFTEYDIKHVDYRDVHLLSRFIDSYGRIIPRRRSGLRARFQREVGQAIKRARQMALMPYIKR